MALSARQLLDRQMSEADVLDYVRDLAARTHFWFSHFHDSRREVRPGVWVGDGDAAGFPDCVLVKPGAVHPVIFAELKRETGRVTAAQADYLDRLRACGLPALVVRPSTRCELERLMTARRSEYHLEAHAADGGVCPNCGRA